MPQGLHGVINVYEDLPHFGVVVGRCQVAHRALVRVWLQADGWDLVKAVYSHCELSDYLMHNPVVHGHPRVTGGQDDGVGVKYSLDVSDQSRWRICRQEEIFSTQ